MKAKLFQTIILGLFLHLSIVSVGQSCVQHDQNYYTCGIPTEEFEFMRASSVNAGSQVQSNWCWAACIQMLLNYHGLYVNQADVVTKIYGSPYVNLPANEYQILQALNGWIPDSKGKYSVVYAYGGYTTVEETVNALSGKWPLIVGLMDPMTGSGHAYVLTAITYYNQYDYFGNITGVIPEKVVLRDPWPGNPSRQEWNWYEFQNRCMMAVKVWVGQE